MRSACTGLPFYRELKGRRYCVLHYPGKEKRADFKAALDSKLNRKDFDFRGVWFPDEVDFNGFEFSSVANFRYATFRSAANFSYAQFEDADFSFAKFKDTNFHRAKFRAPAFFRQATFGAVAKFSAMFEKAAFFISAKFKDADFSDATFRAAAYFSSAKFKDADFISATFTGATDFNAATFSGNVNFRSAILVFNDSVKFLGPADERSLDHRTRAKERGLGNEPSLDFQYARIETPGKASFHTVRLRPHWFVNIDAREFVFTDVEWELKRIKIKKEIAALESKRVSSPNRLLAIACRQLAENAEANGRYEEASRFRYWAMDLARRTKWKRWSFWKTDWLHVLYGAVSGYGERILWALGWLLAVWILFALFYTWIGFTQQPPKATTAPTTSEDTVGRPLEFSRALTYSLEVMSLQKPEPRPLTNWAHWLVTLETVLGPVQAALLLLAIRRKFMR
jgi:hypothetical protein